jgi:hypothetical protein
VNTQLYCPDEERRVLVTSEGVLNAIDYLEVLDHDAPAAAPPQRTLLVHCLLDLTGSGLTAGNVVIDGGVRVTNVKVDWAWPVEDLPAPTTADETAVKSYVGSLPNRDRILVVRTSASGDLSQYTLKLVASTATPDIPPPGFDPLLSEVGFSFKVECESDFDCRPVDSCLEPVAAEPHIDYLAKDYSSFRRLMLDRLAVVLPGWKERSPADIGVALVELLAYRGDYLSYFQDAVAAEAYLGTACRRVSVRRHARLVDYFIHDGMNARAWISVNVGKGGGADGGVLLEETPLLVSKPGAPSVLKALAPEDLAGNPIVFETLHPLGLSSARNEIPIYTWRDPRCCLPKGATHATLEGTVADLGLEKGDVILFEEVLGPNGRAEDRDPSHRHVVRLVAEPVDAIDPSTSTKVVEIRWHQADALPFALDLTEFELPGGGTQQAGVARGNVVLAAHGMKVEEQLAVGVTAGTRFRATLTRPELTYRTQYDDEAARELPAAHALERDVRSAMPHVQLLDDDGQTWSPQRDLLSSGPFALEFVAEMENDGRARLRFGDGVLGHIPRFDDDAPFHATYRVGNGARGNVGADALTRVVTDLTDLDVRNPLPATGGSDPETIDQVRLFAPQAFRRQERAVTPDDYTEVAERHPEIQSAVATRRWTGSWHTMFVTVDRAGGRAVDDEFETELRRFLEHFRMAGYDIEIEGPRFVPLEIVMTVCVADGYIRSNVEQSLLEVFSSRDLPGGRRGFFHPDNFTFGQPVFSSAVVAAAMDVAGVQWVDLDDTVAKPNLFKRWGEPSRGELANGRIDMGRLEVVRLDNDPNAPENGRIEFVMGGGL